MIPAGWKQIKLKDAAVFRRGSFPQPYGLDKWYDDIGGIPFVQVYDVDFNGKLKPTTKRKISKEGAEWSVLAPKGTILVTIQGSIGRVAITQYDAYVDRTLLIISSFKTDIEKEYFAHILKELFEIERHKAPGGTIKTITKEALSEFSVLLPPISEQRKIAQIFSCWDRGIEEVSSLISFKEQKNKEQIGFKLKEIERQFGVRTISEIGDVVSGGTPDTANPDYWEGDINWVTPTDITALTSKYLDKTSRTITQKGLRESSATMLPPLSIIVCTRATVGQMAINTVPMTTNQGFKSIVPRPGIDPLYLFYAARSRKNEMFRLAAGSTFLEISKRDFSNIAVPVPTLDIQVLTGKTFDLMDQDVLLLKQLREQLLIQKRGLIQQLLTGRLRVKL